LISGKFAPQQLCVAVIDPRAHGRQIQRQIAPGGGELARLGAGGGGVIVGIGIPGSLHRDLLKQLSHCIEIVRGRCGGHLRGSLGKIVLCKLGNGGSRIQALGQLNNPVAQAGIFRIALKIRQFGRELIAGSLVGSVLPRSGSVFGSLRRRRNEDSA
jgi:hypothetical protein